MKLALVAFEDIREVNIWAGIPFFVAEALNKAGIEVCYICSLPQRRYSILETIKRFYYNKIRNKKKGVYRFERNERYLRFNAKLIETKLKELKPDLIISFFPYQVAYLKTPIPIIIWTDATFKLLSRNYSGYSNFCIESYKQAIKVEELAFRKANLLLFSSNWALNSAINEYNIDKSKVRINVFGSNSYPQFPIQVINEKKFDVCKLLFIGFDPIRKGLNKAIQVCDYLIEKGIAVELKVIGPVQLEDKLKRDYILFWGKLDKSQSEDFKMIQKAYCEAHFLLLPSTNDATPIVFCESSSYGVPIITHDIGGISDIVFNNVNGYLFSLASSVEEMAMVINSAYSDKDRYYDLSRSTLAFYKRKLNWEVSIKNILDFTQGRLN